MLSRLCKKPYGEFADIDWPLIGALGTLVLAVGYKGLGDEETLVSKTDLAEKMKIEEAKTAFENAAKARDSDYKPEVFPTGNPVTLINRELKQIGMLLKWETRPRNDKGNHERHYGLRFLRPDLLANLKDYEGGAGRDASSPKR